MPDTTATPPLELSGEPSQSPHSQVTAKVVRVLSDHLGIPADEVQLQSSLVDDLGADSLDGFEIQMALEDEFQTDISDDEGERWKTVADVVESMTRITK